MQEVKEKKKFSRSLSYYAWQKLKKNKLAMAGLVFIVVSSLVAFLGALIRPDGTPMANEMLLQLTTKEPGFSAKVLLLKKNVEEDSSLFFEKMLFGGEENNHTIIPINQYHFEGDEIFVEKYTESGKGGQVVSFNIADVLYSLDISSAEPVRKIENNSLEVTLINGERIISTVEEIQDEIREDNISGKTFVFGTDRFGRDMLSRLMAGTLVSLSVGLISVLISIFIGVFVGALGGFFRGRLDDFIVWIINVVWSIPTLLLVIAITLVLGKGFWQVFIAVGLTMWVEVARVVRGQILSIREKEFVEAGRALGFTNMRLIFLHVLPNVMGPVIVISAANFASAILIEAGLSFLGIGAQPPMASWGTMIRDHYGYIITGKAYLAALPGLAIMFMVLAFMLVGNGLRDALDSKHNG